jgi:hypothetical protein
MGRFGGPLVIPKLISRTLLGMIKHPQPPFHTLLFGTTPLASGTPFLLSAAVRCLNAVLPRLRRDL